MADEITQADRELLAAEYERNGLLAVAKAIRTNRLIRRDAIALRAIAASRRQAEPSAPVGVEGLVSEMREASKSWRHGAHPMVTCEIAAEWADRLESLASAPQPPAEAQPVANGVVQRHVVTKFSDGSTRVEDILTAPSAPVGVGGVLAEIRAAADAGGATEGKCYGWWRALAQQPAAVGGFDAWFDEYSKQNYSEEMLAKAAWDAALAAQQEGAP